MKAILPLLLSCENGTPTPLAASAAAEDETETGITAHTGTGDPTLLCQIDITCDGSILDEPKVPCDIGIESGDGIPLYRGRAGIELRGRSSLYFPKPQYSIELRSHSEVPVWPGFEWDYLDDGTDPGEGWMLHDFDDDAWKVGAAPLGSGEEWLNTEVNGPPTTVYFRRWFSVASAVDIEDVELGVLRDDAVAVYLNGTEILRENLPAGATYTTQATAAVPDEDETYWTVAEVDPELLLQGTNLLAVELHQAAAGDTDARFDLYLDASAESEHVDLFGMGGETDWILNGLYVDRLLVRNKLVFDLFQSFGGEDRYAPETVFCELTVDGEYMGIHSLGERIKRAASRIDLDDAGDDGETFIVKLDDEAGFHDNAVGAGTWQLVYPEGEAAEKKISSWLSQLEQSVQGDGTDVFEFLDLDSAVDWVLLQELSKNVDAYHLSVYLWRNGGGQSNFVPWDFDLSMGYPYYDCGPEGWIPRLEYIDAMAANPAFKDALEERWASLRTGALTEEEILGRIEQYETTLAPAIARNFERWPIDEIKFTTDDIDNWLCPVASYEAEHARVVEFLTQRLAWMDENIGTF